MRVDPLLLNYPVRIRYITVYVLLCISLIFYMFPRILGEGRKTNTDNSIIEIESFDIPQTQQFKLPDPPARPSVPIASDDEDIEDLTIEETDFDDFEEWDAPPPPPSDGPRMKFIPYDKAPEPLSAIRPEYPEIAMEAGIEGTVIVDFFIDEKGRVTDIYVYKGIPNTGLDEAAMGAIKRTRWKPARQRDRKVGVWMRLPINFKLQTH